MDKNRIGGLALLAFLVFAYFVGQSGDSKTTSTSTGNQQPISQQPISQQPTETYRTTATDLFDQYDKNEVATDMALKGKLVEISGRVQAINKNFWDQIYVELETRNEYMPASVYPGSSEEAEMAALQKGQTVVFRCQKMERFGGSPSGKDCVLVSVSPSQPAAAASPPPLQAQKRTGVLHWNRVPVPPSRRRIMSRLMSMGRREVVRTTTAIIAALMLTPAVTARWPTPHPPCRDNCLIAQRHWTRFAEWDE